MVMSLNSHRTRLIRQIRKIVLSDKEKSFDFFRALHCIFEALDVERQKGAFLKGHGNKADFLGFLHKSVRHRSLTLHFERFRS
jgi:hypothetical protein